ncbi:hypothetical protein COOONC_24915 [Cooperia oncophora]
MCDKERNGIQDFISSSTGNVEPSFYYVLKGNCQLFFSHGPMPKGVFLKKSHECPFRDYRPIIFRWDENSIGIVLVNGTMSYCSIVDVGKLISKGLNDLEMGESNSEFSFSEVQGKNHSRMANMSPAI